MKRLSEYGFGEFLEALSARSPAPGGGAAAAATGAVAAALAQMVVAYSLARASLAEHRSALERAAGALRRARGLLDGLAREDAEGYALVNELQRLPEGDARRRDEMPVAVEAALQAPRATAAVCAEVSRVVADLVGRTNPRLASDLAVAAILAEAATAAACWNVRVNLGLVAEARRPELAAEGARLVGETAARRASVESACRTGIGVP